MSDPKWVWWSTHETIQNEVPSVTAILETIIAVPLYWWIALHTGVVLPLLVGAAVAPLVLLRSDQSVALGLEWFLKYERYEDRLDHASDFRVRITAPVVFWCIPITSIVIRVAATLFYLRSGVRTLPVNFRRLVFCTSPAQLPELVPGLEKEATSYLRFSRMSIMFSSWEGLILSWRRLLLSRYRSPLGIVLAPFVVLFTLLSLFVIYIIFFLPPWLYRITIKSTTWFWWPLAFLGGDLEQIHRPKLFRKRVMGTLWAKATVLMSGGFLVAFVAAHAGPLMFEPNDLLFPAGRLLNIDWTSLWTWQVCGLATAVLSVAVVFLFDEVFAEYQYAEENQEIPLRDAATCKFGWIERLARVRTLFALGFWLLAGTQAFLHFNGSQEWCLPFPPEFWRWMEAIYGNRLPGYNECLLWP
jgi:hypothetical protein